MSAVPVSSRKFLTRVMRATVLALAFLCVGSVILMASAAVLVVCAIAFAEGVNPMPEAISIARDWAWPVLIGTASLAGVTGLLAGIYEALFGRPNTWMILIISSLVVSSESLIVEIVRNGSIRITWMDLASQAVRLLSVGSGMVACWKMIGMVREKTRPAVKVAQVFD